MEVMIDHTAQMRTKLAAHLSDEQRAPPRAAARIEELELEVDRLEWRLAEAIAHNEQLTKPRPDRPLRSEDLQAAAPRDSAPHAREQVPHEEPRARQIDRVTLPLGTSDVHSPQWLSPPVEMAAELVGVAQKFVDDLLDGAGGILLNTNQKAAVYPPNMGYDELVALAASLQVCLAWRRVDYRHSTMHRRINSSLGG